MATIRRYFAVFGFLAAAVSAPRSAHATGEACTNDIDCKTGASCGGEICDWTKGQTCQPATTADSGMEGWCSENTHCKCASTGATCDKAAFQCTKTTDATAAGGASAQGGASGTGGTSGAAGSVSAAAGHSTAGAAASTDSSSSSSGCSIAGGMPQGTLGLALGAVCAAVLVGSRRRGRGARAVTSARR